MAHRLRVAILTLLTVQAGAPVGAQPDLAIDGSPSPDACAQLGFGNVQSSHDAYAPVRQFGGLAQSAPAHAAPPPPPRMVAPAPTSAPLALPAPAPSSANEISEMVVVTGARADRGRRVQSAPVAAYKRAPSEPQDTERYPGAQANPIKRVADEPVSTFSVDVDTAAYSNVRRFLQEGQRPPSDAVRVEELVNYFDYGYARPQDRATPFSSYVALAPSPWSRDRQILHVGIQGFDVPRTEAPPLNLVFLIDTSGSMMGPDRLPLAQQSLSLLIEQLRPQDRVAMVAYAGSAGAVLAPTDGRQKLKMRCALGALQAGGSTAGGQGLALAYALAKQNFDPKAVNRVILVTDGDFNVGVSDPAKLKDFVSDQRKSGVYLSVYGYGRGNYHDTMMQALAQNGNGTAAYVDSLQEDRKSVV